MALAAMSKAVAVEDAERSVADAVGVTAGSG